MGLGEEGGRKRQIAILIIEHGLGFYKVKRKKRLKTRC
jgi:hypothetical protein